MAKVFKPCPQDPLKVRRELAIFLAIWAAIVWPLLIAIFIMYFNLPEATTGAFLTYMTVMASGPIGAWIWASQSKQKATQEIVKAEVANTTPADKEATMEQL